MEDVTSPLHATGVGLVMKGFDYLERHRPKHFEAANERAAKVAVKGHSKGPLSGFFSNIINSASEMLKDDES